MNINQYSNIKNRDKIEIEILAPAGSMDAMYAAINAGADAVYLGGEEFGARAYADNPSKDELLNAIDYVHIHDKKIYLTVNTLLKNQEIETKLYDYLLPFYKNGLDAVIVQDIGVFSFIKRNFPKMDIHASTQMAITGVDGAQLLKEMGATRIVTARELTLKEIKKIHDHVDIEIESFIHGAMCYCYSGLCLFSSILGGRSGNRGRCAGPCRQPYDVLQNNKVLNDLSSQYVLSLKDMNTLTILPQIIESGVYSLKIEGRMKSPQYCAGVVSIYRKYVEQCIKLGTNNLDAYQIEKNDAIKLASLYSRSGSTTGYYENYHSKNMISISKPAYQTGDSQFVEELTKQYVKQNKKYPLNVKVSLKLGENAFISVSDEKESASIYGAKIEQAQNKPLDLETIKKQINKTGSTPYIFQRVDIEMDDNIFLSIKQINELRRDVLERFQEILLKKYKREENIANNDLLSTKSKLKNDLKNRRINCCIQNIEQLNEVLKYGEIEEIYISCDELSIDEIKKAIRIIKDSSRRCFIAFPSIFREKAIHYMNSLLNDSIIEIVDGYLVKNVDELHYAIQKNLVNIRTDASVYAFNQESVEYYNKMGINVITQPYELNMKELKKNVTDNSEIIIYGYIPLMVTAGCLNQTIKNCNGKNTTYEIKDRLSKKFVVKNYCNFCYNIIYNSAPLSTLLLKDKIKQLGNCSLRLSFTIENKEQVHEIVEKYLLTYIYNKPVEELSIYTRGHLNRGVE